MGLDDGSLFVNGGCRECYHDTDFSFLAAPQRVGTDMLVRQLSEA